MRKYKILFAISVIAIGLMTALLASINEKKEETQKIVNDVKLIATIYIAEGSYQNNFKQGLWKYSVSNAPHYSEVRYNSDEILTHIVTGKQIGRAHV